MDPLSTAVGTIAIIEALRRVIKSMMQLHNAPKEAKSLLNELQDLQIVFMRTRDALQLVGNVDARGGPS